MTFAMPLGSRAHKKSKVRRTRRRRRKLLGSWRAEAAREACGNPTSTYAQHSVRTKAFSRGCDSKKVPLAVNTSSRRPAGQFNSGPSCLAWTGWRAHHATRKMTLKVSTICLEPDKCQPAPLHSCRPHPGRGLELLQVCCSGCTPAKNGTQSCSLVNRWRRKFAVAWA